MPTIIGANQLDTGYDVEGACRFDNTGGDALGGTFGTPTNAKKFTLSFWYKKSSGTTSGGQVFFGARSGNENIFLHEDTIRWDWQNGSKTLNWAPLIRDQSAWYHFVFAQDTSQSTNTNRAKLYVNGTQITTLRSGVNANYPDQNLETGYNVSGQPFFVSSYNGSAAEINGYLAEVAFIDGTQYDASYFGETDNSGIWIPKEFKDDVTFGNNGFLLEFKQTGTGTNSSGIGADTSGNDNHLAVTNLTAGNIVDDTPTNNFATINDLAPSRLDGDIAASRGSAVVTEGDLKVTAIASDNDTFCRVATMGVSSGKWYWEMKIPVKARAESGIAIANEILDYSQHYNNETNPNVIGVNQGGNIYGAGGEDYDDYENFAPDLSDNDIVMWALDMDNYELWYGINGTWADSGDPTSGATGTGGIINQTSNAYRSKMNHGELMYPFISDFSQSGSVHYEMNFGNPIFSISSGNSDSAGYGNFEYAVPSGYYALCTKNLAKFS